MAIVGMACVMPGAPDVEAFWANIVDGIDSVTEVPASRWTLATHYDPDHDSSARGAGRDPMSVSKWGGFVPDVGFDALRWASRPPAWPASTPPSSWRCRPRPAPSTTRATAQAASTGTAPR